MARTMLDRAPGLAVGAVLAPFIAVGSALRHARFFHPRGVVLWGRATATEGTDAWHALGRSLEGAVLVRFSGAWWKNKQWLDVLGCAVRFTRMPGASSEHSPGDQDLLLATIRVPATTLLAPLTTHVEDYLRNAYFGVSPFRAPGLGKIKLRLTPLHGAPPADSRAQALDEALELEPIRLHLEARPARLGAAYRTIATIELFERVAIDQDKLSFDPYRTGRDLVPSGFVHAMRIPVYAASRKARSHQP